MPAFRDISNQKFGRLTVMSRAEDKISSNGRKRIQWNCVCDCGANVIILSEALTSGNQLSCGCYKKDKLKSISTTHGKSNTRLYSVWCGIRRRCYNRNCAEYEYYGGRGIVMCDDWFNDFSNFYAWAMANGYDESAPRGQFTIDRVDSNGIYSPENCRLITQAEQMNNVRTNHMLEYNGESHTIAEWSRITGINQFKIRNRVSKLGWTVERALETI